MPELRLRLDPWPAEYDSSFQIEDFERDGEATVDVSVEGIGWRIVEPVEQVRPEPIYFVDGVRRVDARVLVDDGSNRIARALFGSIGVGAVRVERRLAAFEAIGVKRYLVAGSGLEPDTMSVRAGSAELVFESASVPDSGPAAPLLELQNLMRVEEASLAKELAKNSECVFADGPLTYFSKMRRPTVGIIKRLVEPYLTESQFGLVRRLERGDRTPLFVITRGKYDRFSWYLRAGTPRAMDHEVAGVLRLEVRSGIGLKRAVELANLSSSCIPAFAGESFRDPRSPQNLLPIGSLERELRHRLGDALAIRRAIEVKLFGMNGR